MDVIRIIFICLFLFSSVYKLEARSFEEKSGVVQQINQIIISVNEDGLLFFNEIETDLDLLEKQISDKIDFFVENGFDKPTVTIRLFEETSDKILEDIKVEVRKTSIEFIDIQHTKKIEKKAGEVDSLDIQKYRSIINKWKSQPNHQRSFSKEDVEFVRNIYKRMNFNQMMHAGKLPSYVPKVEDLDTIN